MEERESISPEQKGGIRARIDLTQQGYEVIQLLMERFGIEGGQVLEYALQEGVQVMITRPPDYYKLSLYDPNREGKYSDYNESVDEETIELQKN